MNFPQNSFPKSERLFLLLSGVFLASIALLNVIGITKFVQIGPLQLAVGTLAYPFSFLSTDLICELYGKKRATFLVYVGFFINLFVILIMWAGHSLPVADVKAPWQILHLSQNLRLPNGTQASSPVELFHVLYTCTMGSIFASMLAYMCAQYCDVYLFHFFKNLTQGKHLWLRNNCSTLLSQGIDSLAISSLVLGPGFIKGDISLPEFLTLAFSNYGFKAASAALDTPLFYLGVKYLKPYLRE